LDAGANSSKSSQRNEKSATEAKKSDELNDKAKTGSDDRNAEKFFKSRQNQKRMQAFAHILLSGSNNQNKGPTRPMIDLKLIFSRRSRLIA
jgi:hypothetical protein